MSPPVWRVTDGWFVLGCGKHSSLQGVNRRAVEEGQLSKGELRRKVSLAFWLADAGNVHRDYS